jgi:hypothetical protein
MNNRDWAAAEPLMSTHVRQPVGGSPPTGQLPGFRSTPTSAFVGQHIAHQVPLKIPGEPMRVQPSRAKRSTESLLYQAPEIEGVDCCKAFARPGLI